MANQHYLLVSCPAQGHMNPTLQLAKRLVRTGAHVTFVTTIHGRRRMIDTTPPLDGLSYAFFSDGYDDGTAAAAAASAADPNCVMDRIRVVGSQSLSDLLVSLANLRPVTCLIYAVLLPWAAEVARKHRIASALLWIQPACVFTLCYHYFHGLLNEEDEAEDPSVSIKLPGLPLLSRQDLPTFFHASSPHRPVLSTFKDHFLQLQEQQQETKTKSTVLVNSFDSIEGDAIRAVDEFDVYAIGPLIPLPDDKSYGCDLITRVDCTEWLSSKPESSVVYVSFGSMVELPRGQVAEIQRALVESGRTFLWATRSQLEGDFDGTGDGLVVEWCSQVEVLSHKSVSCFVSHCGWNSALESVASGKAVVGLPQWSDQMMIAKMVEEEWGCGVRARARARGVGTEEEGIAGSEEIKRCLEMVMGSEGEEIRRNAWRLRDLAREAMGSSSSDRLEAFVHKLDHEDPL